FDDLVSPAAMVEDLFLVIADIPYQQGSFVGSIGRQDLLQLSEEFLVQFRKVVDKIERVLDLVGDAGGELPEGGHFFGLDQLGLSGPEMVECLFQIPRALSNLR